MAEIIDKNNGESYTMKPEDWDKVRNWAQQHSLWIIHFCTGCGAIEMPPTMTARYDMERFGMIPMATPRQADVMLITGYLAVKTLKRVVRVWEQMQSPKYIIGHGSCTINGGMYWDSYNTINQLEKFVPVEEYIAGCMPRPEAIIDGLRALMQKIKEGRALGWKHYEKYYAQYKRNQAMVFKPWWDEKEIEKMLAKDEKTEGGE